MTVAVEFSAPAHSKFDPAFKKTPLNLSLRATKHYLKKGLLLLTTSIHEMVQLIECSSINDGYVYSFLYENPVSPTQYSLI